MDVADYHDLVVVYTKKEEENFAHFRYVQSITNEIEQLEEEKHAIELETEKLDTKPRKGFTCPPQTINHTHFVSALHCIRLNTAMKDGSANARKRLIDDLVEARQKYVFTSERTASLTLLTWNLYTIHRILKENAEYERLRASASREFQPIARAVDRLYNTLGCNDIAPVGCSLFKLL